MFHCMLTSLLRSDQVDVDVVSNIGAILAPVCVSAMQCIDTQDPLQGIHAMCGNYTARDPSIAQAICELNVSLRAQCSLAQLVFTVSAIFSAVHAKYKKSRRVADLSNLLLVIESCAPLLRCLAAGAQSRTYTAVELDALCSLFASCRIEFLGSSAALNREFAPQAVHVLRGMYEAYLLLLQNLLDAGKAELILPAACSIMR